MKRIILILLTTLTISSYVHAEDISYYRIDGMKVGDSLLDYLSEKEILEYFAKDFQEFIQISMPGKKFDIIAINYLKNDENYIIHELSGRTALKYEECLKEQQDIVSDISTQFIDESVQIDNIGEAIYRGDDSGKSTLNVVNFYFENGIMHVACYNISETLNVPKFLAISVASLEWFDWQSNRAFK